MIGTMLKPSTSTVWLLHCSLVIIDFRIVFYFMHALAKDEVDMESTKADTYEFIREKCYMKNQDCAKRPFVIENENIEESNIYEAVESAPMAEQRHVT